MTTIMVKRTAVTLSGNHISGNTFAIKEYIKAYLGGKWNSESKSWTVDLDKVNDLIAKMVISVITPASATVKNTVSHLCPNCHTYCDGDCGAN
jgi:hypothetical protein